MDKAKVNKWKIELTNIDIKINRLEYDLKVLKETKKRLISIAKSILDKCSKCGCGEIGLYEAKAENGAIFRYCLEHIPKQILGYPSGSNLEAEG